MTSGNEIAPNSQNISNPPVRPVEPKPTMPVLAWLGMKARMAGTACLATLAQPATGPVLIACVCLATLAYNKRNRTRTTCATPIAKKKQPVLHRSMSIAALHGGRAALERIVDAHHTPIDENGLSDIVANMEKQISKENIEFMELYRTATKLEMSGKEDDAIKILQKAVAEARKNNQSPVAYELEMILVEMLIYKRDYDSALNCKCFEENDISDARAPLYKAVIYTIKNDAKSEEYYNKFQSIRKSFHWPDGIEEGSPLCGIELDFKAFKRIVENLKNDIEDASKVKAK